MTATAPPRNLTLFDWNGPLGPEELPADEVRTLRVDLAARAGIEAVAALPEWTLLADGERARAKKFVRPRDGRRFTLCRAAVRSILGMLLNCRPAEIAFRAGPGGKPELAAPDPCGLRFNVTHSDDLALVSMCRGREVGVDVEKVRVIAESARIVESYFTSAELAQFAALDESSRMPAFLRGWTRKEAILKAQGVGLAGLATTFETMFGTAPLRAEFKPTDPYARVGPWSLFEVEPRPGYVAAVAVAAR